MILQVDSMKEQKLQIDMNFHLSQLGYIRNKTININ